MAPSVQHALPFVALGLKISQTPLVDVTILACGSRRHGRGGLTFSLFRLRCRELSHRYFWGRRLAADMAPGFALDRTFWSGGRRALWAVCLLDA